MTPDDAARKALEEAHGACRCDCCNVMGYCGGKTRCEGGSRENKYGCFKTHIAINRLARAAWEAGLEAGYTNTDGKGSWLPPKETP